jgi:tRNA A-37 threonylcarbamoyl transferase component Bud32
MMKFAPRPARIVPPLAAVKLTLGLVAFCITYPSAAGRNPAFPYVYYAVFAVVFGATGALLLIAGRNDRRALSLGGFFLAAATAWCNAPLRNLTLDRPSLYLFALVGSLGLDAFLPYFLWAFVRDFPSPAASRQVRRLLKAGVRLGAAAGLLLFGLNVLSFLLPAGLVAHSLERFSPQSQRMTYYGVITLLVTAAFVLLPWKALQAEGEEQRRGRVFLQLLGLILAPMVAELLLDFLWPGYHDFCAARPSVQRAIVTAVLAPALALPVAVPYAVLVHRVLDVRLIARRALRHTLARALATALAALPLAALGAYVIYHHNERVTELFTGHRVPLLAGAALIAAAALSHRKRLLDAVDRRFFREQYDARQILTSLVGSIRSIRDSTSLADLISREIDLAFHLERIALLALDARSGLLVDPRHRALRLDPSSPLALAISSLPLDVDPQSPALLKLPERERQALVDSGFRLLVPILARDGSLLGLVALGEKKSGLPFLREDRELLHAIASNAAWVLELEQESTLTPPHRPGHAVPEGHDGREPEDSTPRQLPATPAMPTLPMLAAVAEPAKECAKCGALHPSYTVFCGTCSRRLEVSAIPYILPGRFRFERRIGAGGMGVVYAGSDLALGRRVAIKTLRQVSADDAMRLRREARTAAAVSHPHLAPIYCMETWQGRPMLVMELLEGGTLAQRIAREKLSPRETVELGAAMAGALAQLHAADILHRDVKPSNIGYTRSQVPKLMDFGIARVMFELAAEEEAEEDDADYLEEPEEDATHPGRGIPGGEDHRFAGTLSYLSPEALRGAPADVTFDLWGLAIVLYECLLGRKVFVGTQQQVMDRIRSVAVPDFSQVNPQHDETLGEFFRAALHRSPHRRPASAYEMAERLEEILAGMGG